MRSLLGGFQLEPTVILLLSSLLLSLHRCFGSIEFATQTFEGWSGLVASVYMFGTAFLLLGIVPFCVIVFLLGRDPREYGLSLGDWRLGSLITLTLFPAIACGLLFPASMTPEMREFYPFAPEAADSPATFAALELSRGLLFYTSWEFFFRGFMLFGLRRYVGDWLAICTQVIPQCLWHIGMPTGEIFSSIAGGVLFGVMALRTNSILWPLLLHWLIGVGLDVFIVVTS